MEKFVIGGRRRLSGSVTPSGNKNEALPVIAATLLTEEPVILRNVFAHQGPDGFVPHLTYWVDPGRDVDLWGRSMTSCITQPPPRTMHTKVIGAWSWIRSDHGGASMPRRRKAPWALGPSRRVESTSMSGS